MAESFCRCAVRCTTAWGAHTSPDNFMTSLWQLVSRLGSRQRLAAVPTQQPPPITCEQVCHG